MQNTFNSTKITTKRLMKFTINKNQNIKMWDSFGVKGTNYKNILDHLISGRLKEGYNQYQANNNPTQSDIRQYSTLNDQIHVVLLAISVEHLKEQKDMEQVEWLLKQLGVKYRLEPIIILTKAD